MDRIFTKAKFHLRNKVNRFVSFYFTDFNLIERIPLWKNHFQHKYFSPKIKSVLTKNYSQKRINFHVISLEHRTDKRGYIESHFEFNKISFQFFPATNGNNINEMEAKLLTNKTIGNISAGSQGCAISHIKLWRKIESLNDDGIHIIFEDDVLLEKNFHEKLNFIQKNYPIDCDIFYLGGFNSRFRDIKYFINQEVFRSFSPRRGLYAYIVTPKSCRKMLNLLIPFDIIYGGIDTKIGKLVRNDKILAYQIKPSIVDVNYELVSNIYNYSVRKTKIVETL